jgi:hypothetical protein
VTAAAWASHPCLLTPQRRADDEYGDEYGDEDEEYGEYGEYGDEDEEYGDEDDKVMRTMRTVRRRRFNGPLLLPLFILAVLKETGRYQMFTHSVSFVQRVRK